ncbi:MAG: GntR family transcriptional regulator [bacterium]|nr:GntR family transcriptional regulator [bacterium]MDY4101214.1 GntR family transcriptional regulator [Lachnospiraceae bacterium]
MDHKEYKKVIDYICQEITDGRIRIGDRLPTERLLAEQMGVSRNCVREALRSMETFGLIECRQGSGNYLSCRMSEPISEIFSIMLMLGTTNMEDVKAFRMELDKQACRTLAERADRVDIADTLVAILGETPGDGGTQAIEVDARFHYELLQLQGNRLWMTIADAIFPVYRQGIKDTLIHASEEEQRRFSELHRAICEGIRAGSYEQCAQAIEEHYQLLV